MPDGTGGAVDALKRLKAGKRVLQSTSLGLETRPGSSIVIRTRTTIQLSDTVLQYVRSTYNITTLIPVSVRPIRYIRGC